MAHIMEYEEITLIHESQFSAMVAEVYGRPYQLQQQQPMGQDTVTQPYSVPEFEGRDTEYNVSFAEWSTRDPDLGPDGQLWSGTMPQLDKELWWHRQYFCDPQMILNDLHAKSLIPAGTYRIHVWW